MPIFRPRMATPVVAAAADRIIAAAALAHRYPNARIVYSGGSANLLSAAMPGKPITRPNCSKASAYPKSG